MPIRGAASITRRAVSAPARCPAERGNPREVAHRPFPSEMIATCSRCASANTCEHRAWASSIDGWGASLFTGTNTGEALNLRRKKTSRKLLYGIKSHGKFFSPLALPRGPNKCFHMIEIALESPSSRRRQFVFGLRLAAVERLRATEVLGLFEPACMHAEIAVGGL